MGETSIPCRAETRDRLRDDKTAGVSWDRYLNDLLDAAERADDHEAGVPIGEQLDRIQSAAETAEERTGTIERKVDELGGGR